MKKIVTITTIANSFDGLAAPSEVQVIPFGAHETDRGAFTLDEQGMKGIIGDFESRTNDMVIDYEHQSLGDGEAPAAGWIKRLINKGADGVWAIVEWTPRAVEYLKNREYRYLSPVFMKRTDDNRVVRLLGAALTNTPAIDGMVPVVNKNQGGHAGGTESPMRPRKEEKVMTKLLSALGLTAGASEEEALKSIESLKSKSSAAASREILTSLDLGADATVSEAVGAVLAIKQASKTLDSLNDEMSQLKVEMSMKDGEALVAQAMSEGKITPAQREWATAYAQSDPEGFKVFVARTPVVVPTGEIHSLGTRPAYGPSDSLQISVNKLLMVSDEAFNKFSKKEE